MKNSQNIITGTVFTGMLLVWTVNVIFLINIPSALFPQHYILPLGTLVSGILFMVYFRKLLDITFGKSILVVISILFLLAVSLGFAGLYYDYSFDGQWYHQQTVIQLANGWNIFETRLPEEVNGAVWINHYAKAPYLFQAAIYSLTGKIETAKGLNFMLAGFSFLLLAAYLRSYTRLSRISVFGLSALTVSNPVVFSQLFTFLIDGIVCSLLLIFVLFLFHYHRTKSSVFLWAMFFTGTLTLNAKFTAAAYLAVICFFYLMYVLVRENRIQTVKIIGFFFIMALWGVAGMGYHPYVQNTVEKGHPFYPIAGKNKIDIAKAHTSPDFNAKCRLGKFAISLFSRTETKSITFFEPEPKMPFTFTAREMYCASDPQVRVGGMGVLFSGIFLFTSLLAIVYLIFSFTLDTPRMLTSGLVITGIFATIFINPEPWWARYIAQIWWFPVLMIVECLQDSRRFFRGAAHTLILLMVVNQGIFLLQSKKRITEANAAISNTLELLKQNQKVEVSFHMMQSNKIRLQEAGIVFNEVKPDSSSDFIGFPNADTQYRIIK
jgi:hypothetical protein